MKEKGSLSAVTKIVKFFDSVIDDLFLLILVLWLAYGMFSLWDNYNVMTGGNTDKIYKYKPPVGEDGRLEFPEAFNDLVKINGDVVAWITIPETNIDYPIVQKGDDVYYLNHDFFDKFSMAGCPFLDAGCSPDFSDVYNLVYGHHIEGSQMFGGLDKFKEQSYFDAHPKGMLHLRGGVSHEVTFIYCSFCDANLDAIIFSAVRNQADSAYVETLNKAFEDTALCRPPDHAQMNENSRYIALSTCADDGSSKRIVLVGILEE